jgi:hypothetical protein
MEYGEKWSRAKVEQGRVEGQSFPARALPPTSVRAVTGVDQAGYPVEKGMHILRRKTV